MPTKSREQAARRTAHVFALTFCLLAGGIVTAAYFYYWHFAQHYRAKVEQDLATIGDLKVGELEQFRHERLADAAILFKNDSISALVRRILEAPKDADARRQLETWMGKYLQDSDYDVVRLLDAQGVTRLSLPAGLPPVSSVVQQGIPQVLRSGQVTIQDFHRNEYDQRIYLDLLIPILPEQGAGRPLGIFYLRIDPEMYLYPTLTRWPIPSATAESALVRRDGDAVLYLSERRTQKGTALKERVPLTETHRAAVMAVVGREGIVQGVAGNGNPVVAYVRAVPDSPWFVVLRQETGEAYAPVREQLWLTIALAATLLAGLGAGFGAIWRGDRLRLYREREEAAEALHQSEERYLRLFENNPYPAWVYDLETLAFLAVNPAALDHYGYSRDEFLTMTIKDIRPAEDQPRLAENLAATRQQLERAGVWRHRKKDGTVIDVEIRSHTLDYEGRIAALVIPIDITERKQADLVLRERSMLSLLGMEVNKALASRGPLREALQGCCAAAVRNLDAAFARIWTLEEGATVLELQASAGLYTHIDGAHRQIPVGQFKIGRIAAEREPHLTNTVIGDPQVANQEWAKQEGMVAFAGYPLTVRDRVVGVMALFARHSLSEATIDMLGSVASEIAFGIQQKRTDEERERLVAELQGALARVKTLSGLVPICAWCKKIRDDGNYWHQVESYVSDHTDATFSHGVCPECLKKHYPEFEEGAADAG